MISSKFMQFLPFALLLLSSTVLGGTLQSLTLYSTSCVGPSRTLDASSELHIKGVDYYRGVGVWKLTIRKATPNPQVPNDSYWMDVIFDEYRDWNACHFFANLPRGSYVMERVVRVAGADLSASSLALFTETDFDGMEISLSEAETEINFERIHHFRSIAFTGNYTWTFFSEPNFSGQERCAKRGTDAYVNGEGITSFKFFSVDTGSIRRGCQDESLPPTPTTVTSTEFSTLSTTEFSSNSTVVTTTSSFPTTTASKASSRIYDYQFFPFTAFLVYNTLKCQFY